MSPEEWWHELAMLRSAVEAAVAWIANGAEPSVAVHSLRKASARSLEVLEQNERAS